MEFEFHQLPDRTVVRGKAHEVQSRLEEGNPQMGFTALGALLAMTSSGQKRVFVDFSKDPGVDDSPFEVTVTQNKDGEPTTLEFRFLENEEQAEEALAHG